MRDLKDIIVEKLKISKTTESLSFTFDELCDSILRFVNVNTSNGKGYKFGTEYEVKIFKLDYFNENPLIIKDETPLNSMFKLQGCRVGTILFNTNIKYSDHITCRTENRSITLKDKFAVDRTFEITEETFNKIFNIDDLEKLYSILNEEI